MNYFWLDASALAKRYVPEKGTALMNHLFSCISPSDLICLLEGIGEVISILVRRYNSGGLTQSVYRQVLSDFHSEISNSPDVKKIHPTTFQVLVSWDLIEKHSINSTDAVSLKCAFDEVAEPRPDGDDLVLVSADGRLIRAAKAEGLLAFNPETDSQQALDALIN
jgi:hypothetical protein